MVTIKEAKSQRNNIDVEGTVKDISEPRDVTTKYGSTQVCDAYLEDDAGERIKLSLWGDDIKKVRNDAKISIKGGYTNTFRNEIQLNIPKKTGELKVIG